MRKEIPSSYLIATDDYRDVLKRALQSPDLSFDHDDVSDWQSIGEKFRQRIRNVGGDDALESDETSYGFDAVIENFEKCAGDDATAHTDFCQMLALVRLPENAQRLEPPVGSQTWYWVVGGRPGTGGTDQPGSTDEGRSWYAAFPDDGIWVWQETDPRTADADVRQRPVQEEASAAPEAQVVRTPQPQESPAQEEAVLRAVNEVGWRDVPRVSGSAMRLLQDASGMSYLAVTPDGTFVTNDDLLRAYGNTRYTNWEDLSAAVEAELRPLRAPEDLRHIVVDLMAARRASELGKS